jgi:hypothetical protein
LSFNFPGEKMTRSRRILLGFAAVILVSVGWLVYDISRQTTFPGSGKPANQAQAQDSLARPDSLKSNLPPKSAVHQP